MFSLKILLNFLDTYMTDLKAKPFYTTKWALMPPRSKIRSLEKHAGHLKWRQWWIFCLKGYFPKREVRFRKHFVRSLELLFLKFYHQKNTLKKKNYSSALFKKKVKFLVPLFQYKKKWIRSKKKIRYRPQVPHFVTFEEKRCAQPKCTLETLRSAVLPKIVSCGKGLVVS